MQKLYWLNESVTHSVLVCLPQRIELCKCLYKLYFQLMQLFELYTKLVQTLKSTTKPPQVCVPKLPLFCVHSE